MRGFGKSKNKHLMKSSAACLMRNLRSCQNTQNHGHGNLVLSTYPKKVRSIRKKRQYIKFLIQAPDWWGCHPDHLTMGSFAQAPFQMVQKIMNVVTEMTSSSGTPTINIPQSLEVLKNQIRNIKKL